jgi:hypothetical protein
VKRGLFLFGGQNPARGGAAEIKAAADLGFADTRTIKFPDLAGSFPDCHGPTQVLAFRPRFAAYSRMARICKDKVCWSCVDTRAYSPPRNIFSDGS